MIKYRIIRVQEVVGAAVSNELSCLFESFNESLSELAEERMLTGLRHSPELEPSVSTEHIAAGYRRALLEKTVIHELESSLKPWPGVGCTDTSEKHEAAIYRGCGCIHNHVRDCLPVEGLTMNVEYELSKIRYARALLRRLGLRPCRAGSAFYCALLVIVRVKRIIRRFTQNGVE